MPAIGMDYLSLVSEGNGRHVTDGTFHHKGKIWGKMSI